jgi:NAD(P)H-hydrate epimerase
VFGFSFKFGEVRDPYSDIITLFAGKKNIISVDVPSSYPVDMDEPSFVPSFVPRCVVSLTAPKKCAQWCHERRSAHYLGANIVPKQILEQYQIGQIRDIWDEAGSSIFVELKNE